MDPANDEVQQALEVGRLLPARRPGARCALGLSPTLPAGRT